MDFKIKRVYENAAKSDGTRILVDGLWPRGISKQDASVALWAKEWVPSSELRSWFHKDTAARFQEFKKRYRTELRTKKARIQKDTQNYKGTITLITSVKDVGHSHVPILRSFLSRF